EGTTSTADSTSSRYLSITSHPSQLPGDELQRTGSGPCSACDGPRDRPRLPARPSRILGKLTAAARAGHRFFHVIESRTFRVDVVRGCWAPRADHARAPRHPTFHGICTA